MREPLPIQRAIILSVCGDQGYAAADAAQGQGNPALAGPGKARGDAIDQFRLDTMGLQPRGFFPATTKDARITPFESGYTAALTRIAQHQALDEHLRGGATTTAFAYGDHSRLRAVFEDLRVDQVIDQHHVGFPQGAHRLECQQLWITRARTNQPGFRIHWVFLIGKGAVSLLAGRSAGSG
ncbi:hypothetical protein D3C77_437480 [compost metagenome]